MEARFGRDALIEALASARRRTAADEGAATVADLCEATGMNQATVRDRLRALLAEHTIECVRVYRTRIDGIDQRVPAYRLRDDGWTNAD